MGRRPFHLFNGARRHSGGSAIVQFALVAPLFFLLVLMIVENGLLIFTQAQLDNATRDATRNMLIGTFQQASTSQAQFKQSVCNEIVGLVPSCASNLQVFADTDGSNPANLPGAPSGYWDGNSGTFNMGGPESYMIIQVAYRYPYLISWLTKLSGGGGALLVSTVVLQVEPYQ